MRFNSAHTHRHTIQLTIDRRYNCSRVRASHCCCCQQTDSGNNNKWALKYLIDSMGNRNGHTQFSPNRTVLDSAHCTTEQCAREKHRNQSAIIDCSRGSSSSTAAHTYFIWQYYDLNRYHFRPLKIFQQTNNSTQLEDQTRENHHHYR